MRTLLTILLTSLVWAVIITAFFEPRSTDEVAVPVVVEHNQIPEPTKQEKRAAKKTAQKSKTKSDNNAAKASAKSEAKQQKSQTVEPKVEATPEPTPAPATTEPTAPAPAPAPTPAPTPAPAPEKIDYAREIDGKWTPVVGAEYPLEFTKYNVAIQYRGYQKRVNYSLKGQKLKIYLDSNARCEITKQDGEYYLEIYNSQDFSGKYRRVSQPRKIAMRPLDAANYAELICGKWSPINGQEHTIEFTKYGTAIQYRGYEKRVEYTLNGSSLRIYLDSNASVVISEDASYYYLEIYNSQDFSGRYRKSK